MYMSSLPYVSMLATLHLLGAVIWVGGMFFAHMVLRPAAMALGPPQRLSLWLGVLSRFFRWVWGAVLLIPLTGHGLVMALATTPGWHILTMMLLGWLMVFLFVFLFFWPFQALRRLVAEKRYPEAARQLARIRTVVTINLALGLTTSALAIFGRFT